MNNNIQMLEDTLSILECGRYAKNGKTVFTKLTTRQMEECKVYLPEDIQDIMNGREYEHIHVMRRVRVGCRNIDSFGMAQEQYKHKYLFSERKKKNILVLNFANPFNPGGGVRRGARAQEEDLCRKSSLLFSLESDDAQKYYRYNKSLHTYMGSDAIILTPNVEIIRDANGELLDESIIVSVMTCAAPMYTQGTEGISKEQYRKLFYQRICGMLKCAAYLDYEVLVLGAFGCGAFGNDAKVVSDLFYKALKEFDYEGRKVEDFFSRIDFAVLDRTPGQYNFNEFNRNFNNFYRDEDNVEIVRIEKEKEKEKNRKIREMMYQQLSKDFNVTREELQAGKNIFTKKSYREGRRIYKSDRCKLNILSLDGITVMCSEDEDLLKWLEMEFADSSGEWICDIGKLRKIDHKLEEWGEQIVYTHPFFIPERQVKLQKPDVEIRWYEQKEILQFKGDTRFAKALEFDKQRPDMLAVTAEYKGEILGMAAASADSIAAWQIGIDVVPKARRHGIASYLTWSLREEIIRRGVLPFYGTASSHIQSKRVAYNAGFVPGWWELYSGRISHKV